MSNILELQATMAADALTSRGLVETYLTRIEAIDRSGPRLNAVLELNPDALNIADALDAERRERGPRGPLHGIPILLKGNIDTADRMQTTAGSLALAGSSAPQDAFIVQRLRQAGALILGKANLSEWANFRSSRSSSGWSSQGSLTRNPYALDRSGCGSSTGSAVAVAADLCAAAIGTETDGSITCPAAVNGIVGLKPTLGLLSRSGVIPIAHSQDTAGPMARSVTDVAILLGVLAGADERDPANLVIGNPLSVISPKTGHYDDRSPLTAHRSPLTDYTQFLDKDGLRGARIGVARQYFGTYPKVDVIIEASLAAMRRLGAEVIDLAAPLPDDEIGEHEMEVLLYEFKADLDAYLGGLGPAAPVKSMAEVIAFNDAHADQVMPFFGQERMLQAQAKGPLTEEAYLQALATSKRLAGAEGIDKALAAQQLDAIVAPTTGPAWPIDLVNGDHSIGSCTTPAAVAGYPHITVPAGQVFGLPVGLSFFANAWSEPTLLRLAYAFEQATQARRMPSFLPTVDLVGQGR
ncbi:MAG TPA: amidase family protein [Anaerolineae bacterium]|nr:amidase family protein [Anaerolineae bacterium]